ncbi:DNA-directed RNA polymerase subunit delta [Kyrpidia spormannii]|uniref:Probable DNA-directed RNA polymerase subunit delta n=1 Tax=Kyrpidia spormannii TaxID=2055160 RepID=A0A6F9EIA4_9BACL|nr:DNA-directed RNA polymerase subunit delta [Kyrpidia spormannii]CAB3396310.1 putative DNA-directed RNA polymerase subunit delta [Kyrpidia spormannii]
MAGEAMAGWDPERLEEASFVDLAYEVLREGGTPAHYRDLLADVAQLKGLSDEELDEVIARLFTDINVDGRFIHLGGNVWGLKRWYPTDKTADRSLGKKAAAVVDDEEEEDEDLELVEIDEVEDEESEDEVVDEEDVDDFEELDDLEPDDDEIDDSDDLDFEDSEDDY